MKYYWMSFSEKNLETGYTIFRDICTTAHPFIIIKQMQEDHKHRISFTLTGWNHISREDYVLWAGGHLPVEDSIHTMD